VRVLVDTNVWSLALRRASESLSPTERRLSVAMADLVRERRAILFGIVRQEVLSGVTDRKRFELLRDHLAVFPDEPVLTADHVRAAEMFNACRTRGVQCAAIDILLCAAAERLAAPIFTTDADFEVYGRHIPVAIFRPTSL
jgi:predicted nucleic acid-binding protein